MTRIDHLIRARLVSAATHDVLSRAETLALGLTERQVDRLVESRTLWPLHPGVYAVGRPGVTRLGRWRAAVMSSGDGALLSHHDCGALRGVARRRGRDVHVSVPRQGTQAAKGLRIHVVRPLHPDDVDEVDGIPCVGLERTLLDLADVLTQHDLDRVAEAAYLCRELRVLHLHRQLTAPGRRTTKLRRALRAKPPRTRSQNERAFLELVKQAGLPEPLVNVWFPEHSFEVDVLWPDARLAVEVDSAFHDTPHARERDARKDDLLRALGYTVLRTRPAMFAETLRTAARLLAVTS